MYRHAGPSCVCAHAPMPGAETRCAAPRGPQIAHGHRALSGCAPDAHKLLDAVADVSSSLSSGSLAETWLRMGTRLHDLVTSPPDVVLGGPNDYKTAARCRHAGAAPGWESVLLYSRRCILTAMRLLADSLEAPRPGTHGGLAIGRSLMHPCASPLSPSPPASPSAATSRSEVSSRHYLVPFRRATEKYAMSGNGGGASAEGSAHAQLLVAQSKAALEADKCLDAVRLAHSAAALARDCMLVWYNLQITMMTCDTTGKWDYSLTAPAPPQLLPPDAPLGECTDLGLVTAASPSYFDRVRNLVGSAHVWQQDVPILLYDLGLLPQQAREAAGWRNVVVTSLDYASLPPYFRLNGWEVSTYAFKPLAVAEALQRFACVLWLDSGIELRQGMLLIGSGWPFPNAWAHPQALLALNASSQATGEDIFGNFTDVGGLAMSEVWSGIVGVRRSDDVAQRLVVRPWHACALRRECIAPLGSNKTNHRQDQTALSAIVLSQPSVRKRYRVFTSTRVRAFAPAHAPLLTKNEEEANEVLVFQRRGNQPWPYHKHVQLVERA
eukprot:Tamp_05794.p1 GENE.Tamp_05794~~Tamp_05794.p1  ORF type:complete len:552 (+),score=52.14 Tamp_05794:488-2143(+)